MKKIGILLVMLVSVIHIAAQKIQMTVEFPSASDVEGLKLYAAPLNATYTQMKAMTANGNKMAVELDASLYGFYNIMSVKSQTQVAVPVYVPVGTEAVTVQACLQDGKYLKFVGNADNEALSSFNQKLIARDRRLWTEKLTGEDIRKMFDEDSKQAEKEAKGKSASQPVKDYLNIWSYISTYNAISSLPNALRVHRDSVPVKRADVLPEPKDVLDCEMAAIFQGTPGIILSYMPKGKLADRIDWLRANYNTQSLRTALETSMLENFISKYDYWMHFDEGLAEIQDVVAKYGYDNKYVLEFQKFKRATKGADFPAEVVLKDADGNVVDFAKFKGKYVYIDVWASWCGPCCKEVPVLQKLEAELQNEDVVFVSISVDSSEAPWKSKMAALNMHGNQLFDSTKNLNQLMNIRGIPHFLIYDKEGKLYMYKAPRPSAGGTRDLLEALK